MLAGLAIGFCCSSTLRVFTSLEARLRSKGATWGLHIPLVFAGMGAEFGHTPDGDTTDNAVSTVSKIGGAKARSEHVSNSTDRRGNLRRRVSSR